MNDLAKHPDLVLKKGNYYIVNWRYSSQRYGNCQVCGKHVSEVHCMYNESGYNHESIVGHLDCLKKQII